MNKSTIIKLSALLFGALISSELTAQNVGIDDNTPEQKLDVNGAIKIGSTASGVAGSIRWNGTNYQVWDPSIPPSGGWRNFGDGPDADWTVSGNDMYSQVSGNVGIGTTTPNAKLQVVGTARVSGLNVNGSYSLPTVDGTSGYVLQTNGAGVVSWQPETGDITSVTPGLGLVGSAPIASGAVTLDVNVDGSTLEINADALRVRASGITANEIATDAVGSSEIAADAVGSSEIATDAVGSSEIAANAVGNSEMADNAIGSAEIINGSIATADIASPGNNYVLTTNGTGTVTWQTQVSLNGALDGDGLIYDGINNELDVQPGDGIEIVSDLVRVKASDLEGNGLSVAGNNFNVNVDGATLGIVADVLQVNNNGIGSAQIQDNAIGNSEMADNAIGSAEIVNGSVAPVDMQASSTANQVLATISGTPNTVAWVNPATLTTVLRDGDGDTRINVDNGSDDDIIKLTTVNTERMRIDAVGNVGIGTGSASLTNRLVVQQDNATSSLQFPIVVRNSLASNTAGSGAGIGFNVHGSSMSPKAVIYNERVNDFGANGKLHILMNNVSDASGATLADAKVTVLANGNVGVGETNPTYKFQVNGKIKSSGINETSDGRLKKDVLPIEGALSMVTKLEGVTYNWRTDEFPNLQLEEDLQYGLIAQDVEKVIPELVETDSEGWKSVEYSHFVPVLIEALKEQQALISELKNELSSSNKALNELKAEVEAIKVGANHFEVGLND